MVARSSELRGARPAGVSVVRLLAGAALCGAIGGVLLERSAGVPDVIKQGEAAADRAMPVGVAPKRLRPDMMEPDPLSLRGIPPYPGGSPRRLLGANPGRGLNAISWFSTPDSLDRVLGYYEAAYARMGVMYVKHHWGDRRGYVSWFESTGQSDTTEGMLHMVSASNEGGQTMVFFSATQPEKILSAAPSLPLGVRLPQGATPQVLDMGEFGLQHVTVFAQYARVGRDELADELARVMKDSGWKLEERTQGPDGRISVVARQGQRVQLGVIEGSTERSQILVTVEEQPGPMRKQRGETP